MTYSKISMQDLKSKFSNLSSDELVLDVRSADEFRDGHVPGSRNIPHEAVGSFVNELKSFRNIYVHCQKGGRAVKAADVLAGLGLKNIICVVDSGMHDWIEAGHPMER